ncbi:hypothetical protein KUTeg_022818 [Tegillarca granosa]|uniref:Cytochrome P450 n=1 Tax=Tegillarca granosa TaxID=220873 RepID=A0ABQ9DZX5_TEGGR|nr:hypothetical protein KUTeg_022818 [Tegillarca granosa]
MDWIISFAILAVLLLFSCILFRKKRTKPPGPYGYPIVGSTFSVDATKIHLSLTDLAEKYGDVFEINLFGRTVVVLNSLKAIREAFVNEPNGTIFSDRVKSPLTYEMYHGLADIVFASYSKVWVKRRKLGYKLIKAYGEGMKNIETNISEQVKQTVGDIKDKHGELFDPEDIIDRQQPSNVLYSSLPFVVKCKNK